MATFSRLSRILIFILAAGVLGFADNADAQSQTKKEKAPKTPAIIIPPVVEIPPGTPTKPIQVETIAVRIPANKIIGEIQGGIFCAKRDDWKSRGGQFNLSDPAYVDRLRDELLAAGYTVVGDTTAVFTNRDAGKAEFLIGGMITDITADVCIHKSSLIDLGSGAGEMRVDWQIYNNLSRKVVYQRQTRGTSKITSHKGGEDEVLIEAFASAARLLLSDPALSNLVIGKAPGEVATVASSEAPALVPKLISRQPQSQQRFQDHATEIRGNVATVFAGTSMGSGFFVAERYMITNAHVVGAAKFVKVKFITGREILGEVLTSDTARDVALVQTEAAGFTGLPIRTDELAIGSSVFAVGSPLRESNEGTVSAGIISSYRTQNGQRLIQSDVNVTHGNSGGPLLDEKGNVIGLTVSGQTNPNTGNEATGLNFFIPITDAMDKLGLQFK